MEIVEAELAEHQESVLGAPEVKYVLDGTIKVSDTYGGRNRAFRLLSVSEFLRLDVDKAKGLGGAYSHLMSTLIRPEHATVEEDANEEGEPNEYVIYS